MSLFKKLFGSNEREINRFRPLVERINGFADAVGRLSDEELKGKREEFRGRIVKGETLDDLLPEAFAVVREAADRVIQERHYDVQMLGGIALHMGRITEMKTGEGKTLTSTLAIYLNAIEGKGVHVVTVNDYLARRDCNWMGSVYYALGLSTACIIHDSSLLYQPKIVDADETSVEQENLVPIGRREAYAADITYGTNNEFGFDYLRDNMVQSLDRMVQRAPNFAIVDEVDSILIDEARTPLIISAPDSESTKLYQKFAGIVPMLKEKEDYEVDEKLKAVTLTEQGMSRIENILGMGNLYEAGKVGYVHHLEQSLKAAVLFKLDRDYVVKDGEVIIVDDFTGRLMPGRRYSEGLHQAIEAKEGVEVQRESKTLATITFQNYFRLYNKLSGMTGTAMTSAEEFAKVYKLETLEIPTNRQMVRKDLPDVIYKTEEGKFRAIVEKIKEMHATGQPMLVGTVAIEKSEYLSQLLEENGVKHQVLNAKHHEKEASIISRAGEEGSVTIATNMAGRGTDIKLGPSVRELGGLFIIGTERHEARRIDNQLRGRAGRQGDPGVSQFYVSLEDELMRRFGGDKLKSLMDTLGLPEDQPIQNVMVSKSIETSQSRIEGHNFDIRKHVLDYDDVMNKQRETIYKKRREFLEKENIRNEIFEDIQEELERIVSVNCTDDEESWNMENILADVSGIFLLSPEEKKQLERIRDNMVKNPAEKISALVEYLIGEAKTAYALKEKELGEADMRQAEKLIALQTVDTFWMNHLDEIDYMRQGIGLRGYGQRDPLIEYKREAFHMFSGLLENIRSNIVRTIFKVTSVRSESGEAKQQNLNFQGASEEIEQFGAAKGNGSKAEKPAPLLNQNKAGRNDPCPCGSGKKYKKCCGK